MTTAEASRFYVETRNVYWTHVDRPSYNKVCLLCDAKLATGTASPHNHFAGKHPEVMALLAMSTR